MKSNHLLSKLFTSSLPQLEVYNFSRGEKAALGVIFILMLWYDSFTYLHGPRAEKFLYIALVPVLLMFLRQRIFFISWLIVAELSIAFLTIGNGLNILGFTVLLSIIIIFFAKPFYGILLVTLLIPIDETVDVGIYATPSMIASTALIIAWLIRQMIVDKKLLNKTKFDLILFILIGYITLSILWGRTFSDSMLDFKMIMMSITIYILIIQIVTTQKQIESMLWILCIVVLLESVICVIGFSYSGGESRATGISGDFNSSAEVILYSLFFLIGFFQYNKTLFKRLFLSAVLLCGFLGLSATGSRGPIIILFALFILMIIMSKELRKTFFSLGPIIFFMAILFVCVVIFTPLGEFLTIRIETGLSPSSDSSFMSRVELWSIGIAELDSFFTWAIGIGLGSYHELFPEGFEKWFNPHSLYVLTLVEFGIIGCLILFFFIVFSTQYIYKIWRASRGSELNYLILGFFIMMIAFWIQSVIAHAYYYFKFWFFLALGMSIINVYNNSNSQTLKTVK